MLVTVCSRTTFHFLINESRQWRHYFSYKLTYVPTVAMFLPKRYINFCGFIFSFPGRAGIGEMNENCEARLGNQGCDITNCFL